MAEDIKIKLGLDAGELFAGLNKVTSELNQVQGESKQTEKSLEDIGDANLKGAATDADKLAASLDGVGESAKGASGILGGLQDGLTDAFSGGLIGGLVGGGIAGGIQAGLGAIADGFGAVMTAGKELVGAQGDLQAATGASGAEFEALKVSAEEAFVGGVGGSLAEATKAITQAKLVLKDALPNDQIGTFVKNAQALGNLYDKDVNEVVAKSAPFIKQFGLDGEKAFNLIAFAAKEGKTSQDDVLDTLAEYSGLLKEAGFSAEDFAGQLAVAGQEGLFNTDKIADSIKEAQIRLKAGDTAKAITDLQASLPKALGTTFTELETLASTGQISIKDFLERSGGAIEEAFSAGDISDQMRTQLQVAIAGTPAEDIGAEGYARMFGAPIPKEQIEAKALEAGKAAQNAAGQYLTFDAFTKKLELAFAQVSQIIVLALDGVFKTLSPIIDFISNNLGTIGIVIGTITAAFAAYNIVVGIGTAYTAAYAAVTTAYAAVQAALGGSITVATVAQYAFNLAMSLNPVGAVIAAVALLSVGVYALSEALSVSAEDTRKQSEENVSLIESQKKANEEQAVMTRGTKSMADEFVGLANKKKLTQIETEKMKRLTKDLAAEYPDLVKNTSSYKDNLDGVESIANRAGTSLKNLSEESAKLDRALAAANQTLLFSKRNESIEQAQKATENLVGFVTDPNALKQINAFAEALYESRSPLAAADALNKATKSGYLNAEQIGFVTSAYTSQIATMVKAADTAVITNKTISDTNTKTTTKGGTPAGTSPKSEYDEALKRYQFYLRGIDIYRKEQIDKLDKQGLNKEEIQLKLSQDPNAAPTSEAVKDTLMKTFKADYDDKGNLVLGLKFGKDENKEESVFKVRELLTEVGKYEAKVKLKLNTVDNKEVQEQLNELVKQLEKQSESLGKSLEVVVPVDAVKTQEEFDKVSQSFESYKNYVKGQALEIQAAIELAQSVGDERAEQQLEIVLASNEAALENTENTYKEFSIISKKAIEENTGFLSITTALQTNILDAFNGERIRKERETNDLLRAEKLGALDAEESDLTTSLAKREISFEEYAAKMADVDKARQEAMEATETTFAERFKEIQDKTIGSVLRSQSKAITNLVEGQFKNAAGEVTENGKIIGAAVGNLTVQFATLAESGKATLSDFGNAAAGVAFDTVQAMVPSFIAGILGSSITALGPIFGPIAAGLATASLQLLLGAARSALGFKDGVIGLEGPGNETSDSIPAFLSRGESVITAAGTSSNKEELAWMNANPGLSIRDYFTSHVPQVGYSVDEDGSLIHEVRKLREETRGLGKQINRNTHVSISGELRADNNSIKAVIDSDRRRTARRG